MPTTSPSSTFVGDTVVVKHQLKNECWTWTDRQGVDKTDGDNKARGAKSRGETYKECRGGESATAALIQGRNDSDGHAS